MNLKHLVKELKSQKQIAIDLGISEQTFSNYVNEKSTPKLEILIKIADYFNVSLDYLLDRKFSNDIGFLSEDEKKLLTDYRKLEQINKITLLAELKGMLITQP